MKDSNKRGKREILSSFRKLGRRRLNTEEKSKKLGKKLDKLLQAANKHVLLDVVKTKQKFLQVKVLKKLLERNDLCFDDLYGIPDGVINNKESEEKIWEKLHELGLTPAKYLCLIAFKPVLRKKASDEFLDLVKKGFIKKGLIEKNYAEQVLVQIIVNAGELTTMRVAWRELRKLNPSSIELSNILKKPDIDSIFPDFAKKVRKYLRKKLKDEENDNKATEKIEKLVGEINKLKKG